MFFKSLNKKIAKNIVSIFSNEHDNDQFKICEALIKSFYCSSTERNLDLIENILHSVR